MGLFDTIMRGSSANPADISKMLQDKERADAAKAQVEHRSKMERIANEIHDILLREDITSDDWVGIARLINNDIGTMAGQIKLTKLYGVSRPTVDGSGEGGEEEGEREDISGRESSSSEEPGSGQDSGDNEPGRQGS
jgi:hypothetical protein